MKTTHARPLAATIALTLASTVAGPQALAQSGALEEVIVTATKREVNLQDVPIAVDVLSAETLRQTGLVNLSDVAQLVPSLVVAATDSPFAVNLQIRGIGTSQSDVSLEASVAFIVDGVYLGRSGLGMSDLTDIERVEVLQGPQGTLYGKNANAGVISVVTKNPNFEETEGHLQATLGDYSLQQYTGSITGPVTDTLAYRLAGNWREQDGWQENGAGPDQNNSDNWNLRGKLQWAPTDRLSILLTASYVESDERCCMSDAKQSDAYLALLDANGLSAPKRNDAFDWNNDVNQSAEFSMDAQTDILTVNYDLGWGQLTSLTSWNDYEYKRSNDIDRSAADVLAAVGDRYTGDSLAQEFRLASTLDGALQYLAGLFYMEEENTRGDGSLKPFIFAGEDINFALPALIAAPGDSIFTDSTWRSDTWAVFGQTSYSFTEQWQLILGLRYTDQSKDADIHTESFSTAPSASIPGIPTFIGIASGGDIDQSFNLQETGFTWMASLSYFATPDIMLFAGASTGTKSGGFNGVGGAPADREFKEETTINYELGIKSRLWDDRLKLNATAFYAEFDDLQFLTAGPSGVSQIVSNAAKAVTKGVDLSFAVLPLPYLKLDGGVQYLDADYPDGVLEDFEVINAPDWKGNLATTLTLPLAEGDTYLRIDYSFMGNHQTFPSYQPPENRQDRELLNVKLGWRNDSWDGSLWVKNATDEAYSNIATPPFVTGMRAQFLAPPRTYGATLRYYF